MQYTSTCNISVRAIYQYVQHTSTCNISARAIYQHVQYISTCNISARATYQYVQYISTCNISARAIYQYVQYISTCNILTRAINQYVQYISPCNISIESKGKVPEFLARLLFNRPPQEKVRRKIFSPFGVQPTVLHFPKIDFPTYKKTKNRLNPTNMNERQAILMEIFDIFKGRLKL